MTAPAARLALVPIALSMSKLGSEIQAPLAIAIFLGLLTSTALNMMVVPAAYYRFGARSVASLVRIFRSVDRYAPAAKVSTGSSPNLQVAVLNLT
jgi:hypothetical protein